MKKMRTKKLLLVLLALVVVLNGCGAATNSSVSYDKFAAAPEAAVMSTSGYGNIYDAAPMEESKAVEAEEAVAEDGANVDEQSAQADTSRKLIRNVDMSVETEDLTG